MKRFTLLLILNISITSIFAQQNHFVYLQTDNKQPFYIKLNHQLYSSSSTGYIIVPKLQSGTYNFTIGFPKNQWPQQVIPVKIDNSDLGFMLKNFDDKGWGLFNLQTLEVTMAATSQNNNSSVQTNPDNTADIPAKDSNTVTKKSEPQTQPASSVDSIAQIKSQKSANNDITILSTILDDAGRTVIYTDRNNSNIDTIKIFIPYPVATPKKQNDNTVQVNETTKALLPDTATQQAKPIVQAQGNEKFLNIEIPNPNKNTDSVKIVTSDTQSAQSATLTNTNTASASPLSPQTNTVSAAINSDCKSQADEKDFLKLRKKMAAESNDDDMVSIAKKTFKTICFTTEQIKNLSVLFLQDAGRYAFFEAAYPYVYDTQHFSSLQSQLTDNYYINRFKAMIRH
ncbi:MAG: DUF4476 domain-containing protein [Bacteroidetes bacterium]|nr:DUF4476 domain-containing protein [Bacteroidota bacterium]MBS1756406.1 DUF4476 domain-containing protein [Bacteroidota bacterium]